jgi:hypothetical protein
MLTRDAPLWNFLGWNTQGDLGPWTMYTAQDGRLVVFPRSPPKELASPDQFHFRQRFRLAAAAWRSLAPAVRSAWNRAAGRAHLRITGNNLYMYWLLTGDRSAIETVQRQSGIQLLAD